MTGSIDYDAFAKSGRNDVAFRGDSEGPGGEKGSNSGLSHHLSEMSDAVAVLMDSVERMKTRLAPVLVPEMVQIEANTVTGGTIRQEGSTLSREVEELTTKIGIARGRIIEMMNRVDV